MKRLTFLFILSFMLGGITMSSQGLAIPNTNTNYKCESGRTIGTTNMEVKWNAPGVKGREGKIFGTNIAPFGMNVLGFGSDVESPWRAGANECTTISFSTDVSVNGKLLKAGKYAFFIELGEENCVLIFNKNVNAWEVIFMMRPWMYYESVQLHKPILSLVKNEWNIHLATKLQTVLK